MAKQVRVLSIAVTVTRTAQESREQAEGSSMEDDDLHRSMWCLYFQLGVWSSTPRTGTGLHLHGCFTNSSTSFSLWLLLLSRASLDIYLNFFSIFTMKKNDRVLCTCKDRRGGRKERKKPTPGGGGTRFLKTVFLQERSRFSLYSRTLALPHSCRHRSTHNTSGDAKQTWCVSSAKCDEAAWIPEQEGPSSDIS